MFNRCYAYDKAGNLIQSADQRNDILNYVYDKSDGFRKPETFVLSKYVVKHSYHLEKEFLGAVNKEMHLV